MATSPGIKTSEFLLTAIVSAAGLMGTLSGVIPAKWALIISASLVAIYGVLRTIVKINDPAYVPPELPKT